MGRGFVYVLQSLKSGHYYIGACGDVNKRLDEHNKGVTTATRNKGPWEIRFFQEFLDLSTAKRIEYRLKKLKRRDIIEKIIEDKQIKIEID